jgi:hypothetical protein
MNLAKKTVELDESAERVLCIPLRDPNSKRGAIIGEAEKKPIKFYSRSLSCRAAQAWLENQRLADEAVYLVPEGEGEKVDLKTKRLIGMQARALTGWDNVEDDNGNPIEFSIASAVEAISLRRKDGSYWVLEQLVTKTADETNYGDEGTAVTSPEVAAVKKSEPLPSGDSASETASSPAS